MKILTYNHLRTLVILLLGLSLLAYLPSLARAQMDLTVSPPTAYLKIQPGSSNTHTITIENTSDQPVTVSPQIIDFKPDGQTGIPQLQAQLSFPYLDMPEGGFGTVTLDSHQTAQLTLKINVPGSAEVAEYPMTVLFHKQSDTGSEFSLNTTTNSSTSISGSIGSNLIVLIADEEPVSSLMIEQIKSPIIADSFKPLEFVPIVRNTAVAAAPASGSATITNWQGKTVATFDIFPEIVLGGSTRQIHALPSSSNTDSEQPQPSLFKVDEFLFGPYLFRLTINQTSTDGQTVTSQTSTKFVFSIPYLVLIALAIAVPFGLAIQLKKKWVIRN